MFHRTKRLSAQVIVITGATSGIGLATARLAARRGAQLVLAARDPDALRAVAAKCGGDMRVLNVNADGLGVVEPRSLPPPASANVVAGRLRKRV